jgi:hypothetical protein
VHSVAKAVLSAAVSTPVKLAQIGRVVELQLRVVPPPPPPPGVVVLDLLPPQAAPRRAIRPKARRFLVFMVRPFGEERYSDLLVVRRERL